MSTKSCVLLILAAGLSRRYGSDDKLGATVGKQVLAHHILETVSALSWRDRRVVSRTDGAWHKAYDQAGFHRVINADPEQGLGSSLALGITGLAPQERVLICLADMPFIAAAQLISLCQASESEPDRIFATSSPTYRGPPAIFPVSSLLELPLTGDAGARPLLRSARFIPCTERETSDIDDAAGLNKANQSLSQYRHQSLTCWD